MSGAPSPVKEHAGRVVLVTGASRGIGRAVALELARGGAHIVALARTVGALEELDDEVRALGGTASLVPLDLEDFEALDRLGAALHERHGRLDALVGNAGMLGPISPLGHIDPAVFARTFAVNVTANWRLIRSLDPLLRASPAGRVVLVSSGASWKARPYWGLYAATKAALDALGRAYAEETRNITSVRVMLANPGPLRTGMRAQAMPGEDALSLRTPEDLAPRLAHLASPMSEDTGRLYDFPEGRVLDFRPPG